MHFSSTRSAVGAVVGAGLMMAVLAADAFALPTVRIAAPGGTGTACTDLTPCSIFEATNGVTVVDGDEAVLKPGTYDPTSDPNLATLTVSVFEAVDVHAQNAATPPTIVSTANFAASLNNAGAKLRSVKIESSGAFAGVSVTAGTLEGAVVRNTAGGAFACQQVAGTIRDSVCWSDGATNAVGLGMNGGGSIAATVRNVTAIATGTSSSGMSYRPSGGANTATVDAKSVIADGVTNDVVAGASAGQPAGTTVITLANSNYATELETGDAGASSVTDPGTGTNQGAGQPPIFVNALGGDFHQAASSPTIDNGVVDASSGTADIDAQARTLGSAPDIGADEFNPPAATVPVTTTTAAADTGQRAAALKKCKKKRTANARRKCRRKARQLPV